MWFPAKMKRNQRCPGLDFGSLYLICTQARLCAASVQRLWSNTPNAQKCVFRFVRFLFQFFFYEKLNPKPSWQIQRVVFLFLTPIGQEPADKYTPKKKRLTPHCCNWRSLSWTAKSDKESEGWTNPFGLWTQSSLVWFFEPKKIPSIQKRLLLVDVVVTYVGYNDLVEQMLSKHLNQISLDAD